MSLLQAHAAKKHPSIWPATSFYTLNIWTCLNSPRVFVVFSSLQSSGVQSECLPHLCGSDKSSESDSLLCLQRRVCDRLERSGCGGNRALPDTPTVTSINLSVLFNTFLPNDKSEIQRIRNKENAVDLNKCSSTLFHSHISNIAHISDVASKQLLEQVSTVKDYIIYIYILNDKY